MISEWEMSYQKQCSKCKKIKFFSEFTKNKKGKFGLVSNCNECRKQYAAKYYEKNKEKISKKK